MVSIYISFVVTPCKYLLAQVDYVLLSCFIFYYHGVDIQNMLDFSVLKRTVLLMHYYLQGKKMIGRDYYYSFNRSR